MVSRVPLLAVTAACLALAAGQVMARGRDPDGDVGSRAQQRMERDTQREAQRAEERAARFAEERAKIDERAARDPEKAAEERLKLDADMAREEVKAAEDAAKIQEDFAKESAKESEEAAEEAAELAERGEDSSSHGSSEMIRDLGETEGAEHDDQGFPVRRGELVAIDLAPATLASAEAQGFRVIARQALPTLGREVIRLAAPRGMTAMDARLAITRLDAAAAVDLVHYYGLNIAAGTTPRRSGQRALPARSARPMVVGVIDTAIAHHPALGQARITAWSGGSQAGAPVTHGTAVASIVASEGRATIYSANIFRGPASRPFTSADVIAQALEWMLAHDVPTINMSLAGPRNAILDRLVRDALARGRTLVAAAGNGGPTAPPAYPAAVPGVVAVTAVDSQARVYRYANRGRYITVAAQGVDVLAAHAPGGLAQFTGTSFATPRVAGWMARCRSEGRTARACVEHLRAAARDLGDAGRDDTYGYGLIE